MRRKKAGKSIELADESGEIVGLTTDPDKIRAGRYNRATQKRRASKTGTRESSWASIRRVSPRSADWTGAILEEWSAGVVI